MQKASHIFKVQQCHFPNHILRTFHSDPRMRSMSNYFSFFCFASRRILALTCPGHINRVPNCGEMLMSFKTQSLNFFTNSLHIALKLACLEAWLVPLTFLASYFQTPHQTNNLNSLSAELKREFIGPSKKLRSAIYWWNRMAPVV